MRPQSQTLDKILPSSMTYVLALTAIAFLAYSGMVDLNQ